MVTRYDIIELKAEKTADGWIRDKPIVTRSGIFTYRDAKGKTVKEFRPENEVFSDDSMSSLRGIPITMGHKGIVKSDSDFDIIGSIVSQGERQDDNVLAELVIHKTSKIGNKRELSCGYTCDIDDTPGEWKGERYDSIQKNVKYNHIAIVDKGRAGNARLRLDHDDSASFPFDSIEDNTMPDPTVKLVTIRLDELEYQASPEVCIAYKKAMNDIVDLKKRFDALEAERDSFKTKVSEADAKIAAVKSTARSEIKARLDLESVAGTNKVKFDEETTDRAIKEAVLTKLNPSIKFDGKSDDYVDSAFDIAMSYESDKNKKVSHQKHSVDKRNDSETDYRPAAISGRETMLRRMRGEKVDA